MVAATSLLSASAQPVPTVDPPSPTAYMVKALSEKDYEDGALVKVRVDGVQCDLVDSPLFSCTVRVDQGPNFTTGHKKNHPASPTSAGQWEPVAIPVALSQCRKGLLNIKLWHHVFGVPDTCLGECNIPLSSINLLDQGNEQRHEWVPIRPVLDSQIHESVAEGDMGSGLLLISSCITLSQRAAERMAKVGSFYELVKEAEAEEGRSSPTPSIPSLTLLDKMARELNNSPKGSKRVSAMAYRRHSTPDTTQDISEMRTRSLELLAVGKPQVEEAIRRLKATLVAIEGRVLASRPVEGKRAIDLEWVYRELLNALVTLDPNAQDSELWHLQDTLSFRALVNTIDLKEADKEWLTTEYSREVAEGHTSELSRTVARRVSCSQLRKSLTSSENLLSHDDLQAEYYYMDKEGKKRGPHTVRELMTWYSSGRLDDKVPVKKHSDGQMLPLGTHLETWRSMSKEMMALTDLEAIGRKIKVPDIPSKNYLSYGFDVLQLQPNEIFPFCWTLFETMHLPDIFDFTPATFWNLMSAIQLYMTKHHNPYHNFYHAADVTHACFIFLHRMDGAKLVNELEVFACMVAALCHDLDHPGTNNLYQINRQTSLGLLYNDQSILENHHAATAFKILSREECNITAKMSPPEQRQFRRLMIGMILATDMSYHFKLKDLFDGCVVRSTHRAEEAAESAAGEGSNGQGLGATALGGDEDKEIFLKTVLHTADLCNPSKPWTVSKAWSDLVADEFFQQGDREKQEGLPISPNMNRDTTDRAELALNFGDFIVAPAFVALASLLPKAKECVVHIVENRAMWEEMRSQRLMTQAMDEDKRKEETAKWNKRKVAFEKIVGAEILAELDNLALDSKPRDRRRSLRVLQELVAATAAPIESLTASAVLEEAGDEDSIPVMVEDEDEDEELVPNHLRVSPLPGDLYDDDDNST